ncbi:hypothetical protein [Desulfovibrio sp. ZJ200]|uniref:hypothetical protein n=1 Tax=Desulfovibrio sp. ZJ200 TaxID=2709792 RepID=UPI0013EB58CE|nr:hypothetical protein [Desulfovibrio sp. ZJ200]
MRYNLILKIIMWLCCCICSPSALIYAEENPHLDYMADINTPANAKTNSLYEAWGENMAELIESGRKEGIIIDNENYSDGKVHADGAGNIVVDKNANTGAIINNSEIKNSTVIIIKDKKNRMQ